MGLMFSTAVRERRASRHGAARAGNEPGRRQRRPARRRRWESAFAPAAHAEDLIHHILAHPALAELDPGGFPDDVPLAGIIANDTRLRRLSAGDVLYREGTYETSIYIVLQGAVRGGSPPFLGVAEALTRRPRQSTLSALSDETIVLEIRWPGVRDLRQWSPPFRALLDRAHREHALRHGIRSCPALSQLGDEICLQLARHARFEPYGSYEWSHHYRSIVDRVGLARLFEHEALIAAEGDYLDEIVIVESGFVRVTKSIAGGARTVARAGEGSQFGLAELIAAGRPGRPTGTASFSHDLRAIGYATVIRLPGYVIDDIILPSLSRQAQRTFLAGAAEAEAVSSAPALGVLGPEADVDFIVDGRLFNGTEAMVIDLDRCVHCDECVRACGDAHDGVARFVRQGRIHANLMVTQACMHCRDAVCLIGCPTGAIHRQPDSGHVLIDEARCIGCTICASTCPYGNIQMLPLPDAAGHQPTDADGNAAFTAVKCDLCHGQKGGPACKRACPHDALQRIDLGAGIGPDRSRRY